MSEYTISVHGLYTSGRQEMRTAGVDKKGKCRIVKPPLRYVNGFQHGFSLGKNECTVTSLHIKTDPYTWFRPRPLVMLRNIPCIVINGMIRQGYPEHHEFMNARILWDDNICRNR